MAHDLDERLLSRYIDIFIADKMGLLRVITTIDTLREKSTIKLEL